MRLFEVVGPSTEKLLALAQFLIGRSEDENAKKTVSIDTFISMADNMGISLTPNQLKDLAEQPPLNSVIVNITDDQVIFSGAGESADVTDTMTVTQAQDTVEKMAKRAAK